MEMKFLSASEARKQAQKSKENLNNRFLKLVFESGILPAIQEGRMTCSVKFSESCPTYIIDALKEKGYNVEFGQGYNQYDGSYVDHTKLEISW